MPEFKFRSTDYINDQDRETVAALRDFIQTKFNEGINPSYMIIAVTTVLSEMIVNVCCERMFDISEIKNGAHEAIEQTTRKIVFNNLALMLARTSNRKDEEQKDAEGTTKSES